MKLILITLVALVVKLMDACKATPTATLTPYVPLYTEDEAVRFVKEWLNSIAYILATGLIALPKIGAIASSSDTSTCKRLCTSLGGRN